MGAGFAETTYELDQDHPHSPIWILGIATVLSCFWFIWLFFAKIPIYRSTERAQLIVGTGYEADASADGRVVKLTMQLGETVTTGRTLVELEAVGQQRELQEARIEQAVLVPQLAGISQEVDAEEQAYEAWQKTSTLALDQVGLEWNSSEKSWKIANDIEGRYRAAKDAIAQILVLRADAEALGERAKADNLRLEIGRLKQEENSQGMDRIAKIEELKQERRRLEGELQTVAAKMSRLQYEIDKQVIQAPVTGRIASISPIRIGSFVHQGDRLAVIVPPSILKAVAEFLPSSSLGLIKPGQRAWLHLNGFPWAQYGSITATVTSVASEPTLINSGEPEDERVRVEMQIDTHSAPLIPIQYGLPGSAEIEVERISPVRLIMRAAGHVLDGSAGAH